MIDLDEDSGKDSAYDLAKADAREKLKGKKAKVIAATWIKVRDELAEVSARKSTLSAWEEIIAMEALPDALEKEGVDMAEWAGIGKVTTEAVVFATVLKSNRDAFYAWLRKHKLGDLITETVNSSTLKAWVKTRMAEGKPLPKDLLKVTPATKAKLTRSKA